MRFLLKVVQCKKNKNKFRSTENEDIDNFIYDTLNLTRCTHLRVGIMIKITKLLITKKTYKPDLNGEVTQYV